MSSSSEVQNVVKEATRITHALNKHLLESCPHCQKLFEEVFGNDD